MRVNPWLQLRGGCWLLARGFRLDTAVLQLQSRAREGRESAPRGSPLHPNHRVQLLTRGGYIKSLGELKIPETGMCRPRGPPRQVPQPRGRWSHSSQGIPV